jgi:hypothetical protein
MTDYEKLKALLTEFGVEFAEHKSIGETLNWISCTNGDEMVCGFGEGYTDFNFDKDGKFIGMGVYPE